MKKASKITIGIVGGRGILGQIFRKNFEAAGFEVIVSGRKPDGKKVLSTSSLVKKSDIVLVSVFLKSTEKILREIVPKMRKNQLLADFTSVKEMPLEIMQKAKSEVIGLHPMFGEVESLGGKNIFAVVARGGKLWKILRKSLDDFGLRVHEISASQHDELAAVHQSATHLLSLAFAQLLRQSKIHPRHIFEIASPSAQLFLLTTGRILAQDLEMYADISLKNKFSAEKIQMLAEILDEIAWTIKTQDRKKLLTEFEGAARSFGKWSAFANSESSRVFENLTAETSIEKIQPKIFQRGSVATLGEQSQTALAAREFLQKRKIKKNLASLATNSEIFEAVTRKKAIFGIVPIENSTVGLVRETLLNLFEAQGKIQIFAEFERKIEHALISQETKLGAIEKVFAHPQAAAQSAKFLARKLPHAEIATVENASRALELTRESRKVAAITSAEFAGGKLKVLARNIEDSKDNVTRFVAIGRNFPLSKKTTKAAIAFFFRENKAGQLAAALNVFSEHNINLARLESIPTTKKHGEFFFFVEAERTKKLAVALTNLRKIANVVELGNY
ncbi:MAG: prephenate dehydrogenase/arogenate dehydrogenase family protein [Candidatus Peribacteraceae bacterium]|nr:prephenate dehydrogenase/arogenate dehydrogenase family protein [Candidatus Peribacteraceae bacterium]